MFIARYHYDSKGNKIQFETRQQYENRLRELGFDDETIARYSYNRYNGKSDYEANSKKALENRLLDMYLAVITNANTFNEVRQPLDAVTDYLKNHILSVVDSLTQQSKASTSSPLYYVTPQFQSKTKAELSGGKRGIGPFALAASHHALTQQVGLTLANNKGSEILQRFGITNVSGIRSNQNNHAPGFEQVNTNILDWLSAMINAHVDVAKDPYIIRLNVRSLTYNMTNFLLRTGVGETTFYFLPQQILKDFAVEYDKYAGFYGVDLPAYANPESTAHRNVWNKYFEAANKLATTSTQKKKLADLKKNPSAFLSSELFDINWLMKQLNVKDEAYKSFNWYFNQLRIMKLYDAFTPASRSLSALTTLSQIDTKKFGNNFGLESAFLVRWKNFVQTDGTFNNPLSMFTSTFLYQKLVNGMLFPRDAFKNVMLRLTPQFEIWRNKLHALTGTLGSSNNDTINSITRAMEAQYKSAFFDKYCKNHNINVDELLYGKNSIVNRFYTLRNRIVRGEYPTLLDSTGRLENALLNSLVPRQKYDALDAILPDFFELKFNKDGNDGMDDILIRAWEELSDSEYADVREFARDLAIYSFYTSGDAFGRNNFFKYVPNSLRESLGYFDYIRNLESDPDNLSQFAQLTNPIFRNLWWNEDIVPTVEYIKPTTEFDKATGEIYQTDGKLPNQESGYTIQTDDGKYLDVPGIFMNTRRPRTIGFNEQGDTIYTPYVKIRLNGDLDPRYTMLYRFIGVAKDSQGNVEYPVYRLIPKFGVNMQGMTLLEFGKQTSSIGANNYYYKGSVDPTIFTDYRPIKDIAPTSLKNQVDVFSFLKDINTNPQQLASEQEQTVAQNQEIESTAQPVIGSQFVNHSGGAIGADSYWDEIGEKYGVVSNHYYYQDKTPRSNTEISEEDAKEGQRKVTIAARQMGRIKPNQQIRNKLLIRDWVQVKYADAIFAVTTMLNTGDEMNYGKKALIPQGKGGTGYAMQMAINEGKPVYVYDQVRRRWFSNIDGKWANSDTPILTPNFAGIGTRELNRYGRDEIEHIYQVTFDSITQQSQPAVQPTAQPKTTYDNLYKENGEPIVMYRGYALTEDREAENIQETIGGTAVDYDSSLEGAIYFTSGEEEARDYAEGRTDKGRHYTGDYARVSKYFISSDAKVEHYKNIFDYKKNGTSSDADVIVLDQGTLQVGNHEYVVKNPNVIISARDLSLNTLQETTQSEEVVQTTNDFDEFVRETSEHSNTAVLNQVREQIPQAVQLQKAKEDNGYTFTFNNGFKVSLPFTLNEQQEAALRELEAFVNDPTSSQFTLSGYAGTGKTTVISIFKQYLDDINQKVVFTAPTHRANAVTRTKTPGATVMTLAKLFGLSVDVDLSSNNYDLRTLQARQTNDPKLEGNELIIIDEASMVQDGMYELIQNQLSTYPGTKVIYVGDQGQLRPVKSDKISKVFTDADTPKMQLTKVERTGDNPILKESTRLRNGEGFSYETELVNGEGVTFTNDRTQIATWVKNVLQSSNFAANKTYFKIVAGTNAAVEAWNRYARKVLFGTTEHYLTEGDLITGYNNALRDRFGEYQFINSMDYVVTAVRPTSLKYSLDGETVTLQALDVTLQNAFDSSVNPVRMSFAVPGQTQILTRIREYVDDMWSVYRTAKARGDKQSARLALQKINSITGSLFLLENVKDSNGRLLFQKTADYGYAVTAHKSQSGTFNKVLVDEKSIHAFRNAELEKELKYVAVSRASEDVMVIADKTHIESPITNKPMSNDFSSADQMASDEANALRGIQPNAEASARFQQSLANLGLTEEEINELSNLGTQRKKECE